MGNLHLIDIMILPNSTEDDILRELVDDYQSMERRAKKIAQKQIELMVRKGKKTVSELTSHYVRSKNGNKWHITLLCKPDDKQPWIHRKHCIVEMPGNLRDIYYLRGTRFGKPYFVRIHTHAISRMRERFCPKNGQTLEENPDVMVDKVAFHPSETAVFQYLTPPQVAKSIERKKRGGKVGGLCLTRAAAFVGYRSDKGNYEFLTFLGAKEMEKSKKKWLFTYLQFIYLYVNPKESADLRDKNGKFPLQQMLIGMVKTFPELEPYVRHTTEGMYQLYL